jgi:hypothetical protein
VYSLSGVTTASQGPADGQLQLLAGEPGFIYRLALERRLALALRELTDWTDAADAAVDWRLEQVLDDVRALSTELRQIRNEGSIPF